MNSLGVPTPARPMDTLDVRIARVLREKRIPLRDFLRDFDRSRNGTITEAQLLKGLRVALEKEEGRIRMSALEFGALASAFADPREPGGVRWRDLCSALEKVPAPRAPRTPPSPPASPRYAGTSMGGVYLSPAAGARDADEWRQETARTIDSARASSRAAEFGAHAGRQAAVAASAALEEAEAEVQQQLKREITQLEAEIARCDAALAEGAEATEGLSKLSDDLASVEAALAARRASVVERVRAFTSGRPAGERTADGFVSALLAQVDALNASRSEVQGCVLRCTAVRAELHSHLRNVEAARAYSSYALRVEEEVRALGATGSKGEGHAGSGGARVRESVLRALGPQPAPPAEPLHCCLADLSAGCAAARAVHAAAHTVSERAQAAGREMEEAAEAALEVKADSTAALAQQLRSSIEAHERELAAVRASVGEIEACR